MSELILAVLKGLAAFIATNIDDILILTLLFSQVNTIFRRRHIVVGQYLGFSILLIASLPGFFGNYIVPQSSMRLLGLVPVVFGLSCLLRSDDEDDSVSVEIQPQISKTSFFNNWLSPQTYSVAAVTIANGSDNISVYMPLFANSNLEVLSVILSVFLALVGVWCYAAERLTSLPAIAQLLTGYGSAFVPCVLIGLGVFIVKESLMLAGITIVASCLWSIATKSDNERCAKTRHSPTQQIKN
jgi:cadmium resistance transport/sequestration family protein